MREKYVPQQIEKKWQKIWEDTKAFETHSDPSKKKYYVLEMFPYPSGNLHMGHVRNYSIGDVVARFKKMQGFNVIHPMGFDAFGMPAENAAIKHGTPPAEWTYSNIDNMTRQQKELGLSYDWDRKVLTCREDYYKHTQKLFEIFYKRGLAYKKEAKVNWCDTCHTVLANEQVEEGRCWRCKNPVVKKDLSQWFLKITDYADRLLADLDHMPGWPERVKTMQRNWIGKSTGVEVKFRIVGGGEFSIFTTCIETIYGITFMVLAPDGDIVKGLMDRVENKEEVQAYIDETVKKSDMDRTELNKTKSGCELKGLHCINPVNGREVRMFIGDFVLASYGTGAVMAVPTHDQRDFEYAQAHDIEMIQVIDGADVSEHAFEKHDYLGKGCKLINSEEFTGMVVEDAKEAITAKLEKMGVAKRTVNYKFREWIFARQRYWGEPVPCVYKEDGSIYFLPDDELPLVLPELEDYKGKNGKAPLENATEWKQYDRNGVKGTRETSTMPGSAGSSWYYMRYIDPHNDKEFANQELLKHWMPVDLYVGGPEHAVGHLMYSRIWNRFLFDQGLSPVKEPFKKLVHQGMILGSNGIKMGKRFPEFVVNPSDVVEEYGADTLRLYEMFMGPLEVSKPWNDSNVQGAKRFITRVWNFFTEPENIIEEDDGKLTRIYHQTVKKVTNDFEALGYNTAISQMMIFVNEVYKAGRCPREFAEGLIKMLSCVCPHVGEEIWQRMGHDDTIAFEPWPVYDEAKTVEDTVEIAVQINGKTKGTLEIGKQDPKDEVIAKAKDVIADKLTGNIVKEIYVPGRIVNIVMK